VDLSIVAQTAFVLLRTRLDSGEAVHTHRPIRLWGHRPTRVAMAVGGADAAPEFSLAGYGAREVLPAAPETGERVALRGS
jgi:hypothetical protein